LYAESEHKVSISNTDIEKIVDLVHKIDHVQYKNALAFLAAYYTLDGKTINKTKLDYISKLLSDDK
jgi:tagatose-1,6-bisphosphate aldolase